MMRFLEEKKRMSHCASNSLLPGLRACFLLVVETGGVEIGMSTMADQVRFSWSQEVTEFTSMVGRATRYSKGC
jgi:hypothetical protein